MKYCGRCGFRTAENISSCVCCESLLLDGEGDASRKLWKRQEETKDSVISQIKIREAAPRLLLLLLPLGAIVGLQVKSKDIREYVRQKQAEKINAAVETARQEADNGNWDLAMETIARVQSKYKGNEIVEAAYQALLVKKPTALNEVEYNNLEAVSLNEGGGTEDYYGNFYADFMRFDTSQKAYGEFNTLGKYSQFLGEIHVPADAGLDGHAMWIQIYADGELVYERYRITEMTEPRYFNIDIEGVTSMSIVTGNESDGSYGYLDLVNTYLGIRKQEPSETEEMNAPSLVFPDSDSRYLERGELEGLSMGACRLARNEIYARHGYIFQQPELQEHFYGFDWYSPAVEADKFKESWLNEFEVANRDLIVAYEEEQGYR